jgi:hypothetical protein
MLYILELFANLLITAVILLEERKNLIKLKLSALIRLTLESTRNEFLKIKDMNRMLRKSNLFESNLILRGRTREVAHRGR